MSAIEVEDNPVREKVEEALVKKLSSTEGVGLLQQAITEHFKGEQLFQEKIRSFRELVQVIAVCHDIDFPINWRLILPYIFQNIHSKSSRP
jgi:hypothetical protein